jgi:hypothetical protein
VNYSAHAGASSADGVSPGNRDNVRVLTDHLVPTLMAGMADGRDLGIASRCDWEDGPVP